MQQNSWIVDNNCFFLGEYQVPGLEALWKEEESRYRLRNKELRRPDRPEWGIPEIKTPREETCLKEFRQLFKDIVNNSDSFSSQFISEPRSDYSDNKPLDKNGMRFSNLYIIYI